MLAFSTTALVTMLQSFTEVFSLSDSFASSAEAKLFSSAALILVKSAAATDVLPQAMTAFPSIKIQGIQFLNNIIIYGTRS